MIFFSLSGELPPYFMARGARLSGYDPDDEEMAEFEELQRLKDRPEDMSFIDRAKLSVEKLVERVGFFGILACASVSSVKIFACIRNLGLSRSKLNTSEWS